MTQVVETLAKSDKHTLPVDPERQRSMQRNFYNSEYAASQFSVATIS